MAWQRIGSVAPARSVARDPSSPRSQAAYMPLPADAASFTPPAPPVAADVMVRASIALPAAGVAIGDVLHVQVLGTRGGLELGVLERRREGDAGEAEPAALRPDPLSLYQVRWARPEGAVPLAVAWRAQVLERLAERHALGPAPSMRHDVPSAEHMSFVLQAWRGIPVAMRHTEPEPDEKHPLAGRGVPGLRLAIELPRLGRVAVQLQLVVGGLWLALAIEQQHAIDPIRAALPNLSQALLHAGLRLLRCRLERGLGQGSAFAARPFDGYPSAAMLPLALFRAATEVVLALTEADSG